MNKFILIFQLFLVSTVLLISCKPVELVEYEPTSVEEQFFLSNQWCGIDMVKYQGVPNTKIKTLYKIKLDLIGNLNIASVTQVPQYLIRQNFDIDCDFIDAGRLRCQGIDVVYQSNNQSVVTDLLPRLFVDLSTTQLSLCSKSQLNEF